MCSKNAKDILAQKVKGLLILTIKTYKKAISPLFGSSCRFSPSCSQYAQEALERYGVIIGMSRAFWRILRCNPFSRGGYDPVDKKEWQREEV